MLQVRRRRDREDEHERLSVARYSRIAVESRGTSVRPIERERRDPAAAPRRPRWHECFGRSAIASAPASLPLEVNAASSVGDAWFQKNARGRAPAAADFAAKSSSTSMAPRTRSGPAVSSSLRCAMPRRVCDGHNSRPVVRPARSVARVAFPARRFARPAARSTPRSLSDQNPACSDRPL